MDLEQNELHHRLRFLEKRLRLLWFVLLVTMAVMSTILAYPLISNSGVVAPAYVLTDSTGLVRGEWTIRDGSPTFVLFDAEGRERLTLLHSQEQSALLLKDESGNTRVGAAQFAHGGGGFALHGTDMKGAAVLYHKRGGSLSFFDTLGSLTTRIPPMEKNY